MSERAMPRAGERDLEAALRSAQSGDHEAFRLLYRDLQPRLLRYLRALVGAEAEDVAADAWLQIARDLDSFSGDYDRFRGWASTIARHRALDHLRRAGRRPDTTVRVEDLTDLVGRDDPERDALERLSTDAAIALICGLPRDQAEAVLLRVVVGLDAREAGRVLGKRPGAVRTAAYRGLRRLSERLSAAMRDDSDGPPPPCAHDRSDTPDGVRGEPSGPKAEGKDRRSREPAPTGDVSHARASDGSTGSGTAKPRASKAGEPVPPRLLERDDSHGSRAGRKEPADAARANAEARDARESDSTAGTFLCPPAPAQLDVGAAKGLVGRPSAMHAATPEPYAPRAPLAGSAPPRTPEPGGMDPDPAHATPYTPLTPPDHVGAYGEAPLSGRHGGGWGRRRLLQLRRWGAHWRAVLGSGAVPVAWAPSTTARGRLAPEDRQR